VTSNDVIHSFALPECGIKIDALPGRLNQVFAEFIRVGNYTGMCSELCGVGHAKMPINVIAMSNEGYILYNEIFNI
jgi:heme/copper-type cytochrome/quinol oxidase subunit 2